MIIVKVVGGLASQLHKYAIGRALALRHDVELKLDLSWFTDRPIGDTPWCYELDKYNIKASPATKRDIHALRGNVFLNRVSGRFERQFGIKWLNKGSYYKSSFTSIDEFNRIGKDAYLDGEWAGDSYFKDYRDNLLDELRLKVALGKLAATWKARIIDSAGSVSIHVRRGDYITNANAGAFHYVCSADYYRAAMDKMNTLLDGVEFFVFSDDPDWVETNLVNSAYGKVNVVRDLKNHEDFYLMSLCSANIISNSGFSWNAAWLSESNGNRVIYPKRWVLDPVFNEQLFPFLSVPGWIPMSDLSVSNKSID